MFLGFFYALRSRGIPVTIAELLDLYKVLDVKLKQTFALSLDDFFLTCRYCLIKDLKYFDSFDIAFGETFGGPALQSENILSKLEEWLDKAKRKNLSEDQLKNAPFYDWETLIELLKDRLSRQKSRHDGGDTWIGTGGTSPFGNAGYNPQGIRMGGESGNRTGIGSWMDRKYRAYRSDEVLDIRRIQIALKLLRIFKKEGRPEINLSKTIKKTSENGGDIEIIEERSRKNDLKVVLIMDIGGSMTAHSEKVSSLFSAANKIQHFKEFHSFYFHNIFSQNLYEDPYFRKPYPLTKFFKKFRSNTRIIYLGDAWMAPYELFAPTRNPYTFYQSGNSDHLSEKLWVGIEALKEMKKRFPHSVWLNPEPTRLWWETTIAAIQDIVPMYFLSLDGLKAAIKDLIRTN
jgi:uncharacterized protein with von Willebrand factor type A (vWA) domain